MASVDDWAAAGAVDLDFDLDLFCLEDSLAGATGLGGGNGLIISVQCLGKIVFINLYAVSTCLKLRAPVMIILPV